MPGLAFLSHPALTATPRSFSFLEDSILAKPNPSMSSHRFVCFETEFKYRNSHLFKVYNSFLIGSKAATIITNSRTFLSPQKETPYETAVPSQHPPPPPPKPLPNTDLLPVSTRLPGLDISYTQSHTARGLLYRTACDSTCWPFLLFYRGVICDCMDMPRFAYPFIC